MNPSNPNYYGPNFGPTVPVYPALIQFVRVTGATVGGNVYPCLVQQSGGNAASSRDRENAWVWEPNGNALTTTIYGPCRLIGSFTSGGNTYPLYETTNVSSSATTLTVMCDTGTPTYTVITTIEFKNSSGFVLTQPSSNTVLVDFNFIVESDTGSPSFGNIRDLQFDHTFFTVSQPSANKALVTLIANALTVKGINGTPVTVTLCTEIDFDQDTFAGFRVTNLGGGKAGITVWSLTVYPIGFSPINPVIQEDFSADFKITNLGGGEVNIELITDSPGVGNVGNDWNDWKHAGANNWYTANTANTGVTGGYSLQADTLYMIPVIVDTKRNVLNVAFQLVLAGSTGALARIALYNVQSKSKVLPYKKVLNQDGIDINTPVPPVMLGWTGNVSVVGLYWIGIVVNSPGGSTEILAMPSGPLISVLPYVFNAGMNFYNWLVSGVGDFPYGAGTPWPDSPLDLTAAVDGPSPALFWGF